MNNLDRKYTELLQDILDNGVTKSDRTGTGTISVFGRQIRHKMSEGFPLLTTKKMPWKVIVTELLWFLRGDTNIKYLVDNGCNIWNGDAYKKYEAEHKILYKDVAWTKKEFVEKIKTDDGFANLWGELGPIYGKQWRDWEYEGWNGNSNFTGSVDQIIKLINDLKNNPDSRRLMVNAWNVGEIDKMTLPPCHYGFQCWTRDLSPMEIVTQAKKDNLWEDGNGFDGEDMLGKNSDGELFHEYVVRKQKKFKTKAISLMWNQRSVDTFLGLPFNIASYGLLLEILANEVNMVPDELIGNLGDTHLYLNHIDQARKQIGSELSDKELGKVLRELDVETYESLISVKKLKEECVKEQKYEEAMIHRNTERELKRVLAELPLPLSNREPYELPKLRIYDEFWNPENVLDGFSDVITGIYIEDFELIDYNSHPTIKAELSN